MDGQYRMGMAASIYLVSRNLNGTWKGQENRDHMCRRGLGLFLLHKRS